MAARRIFAEAQFRGVAVTAEGAGRRLSRADRRLARPRPGRAPEDWERRGAGAPARARPSSRALAIWPNVLAPASPKRSASRAAPRPKESRTPTIARNFLVRVTAQPTDLSAGRKYILGQTALGQCAWQRGGQDEIARSRRVESRRQGPFPETALILGSGLGPLAERIEHDRRAL